MRNWVVRGEALASALQHIFYVERTTIHMNKTVKRVLALMLALVLMVSVFAACGDNNTGSSSESSSSSEESSSSESSSESEESSQEEGQEPTETGAWEAPSIESDDYDELSDYYYDFNLGEFYDFYKDATQEVDDVDKRYALEALSEAKLLESAVMFPTYNDGNRYAFGRIAPGSTTTNGWGADDGRYKYAIVTNEVIKTADRDELKKMLNELRGTGTYHEEAKKFLTEKGYTFKDSYNITFDTNPTTWDAMASSRAGDVDPVINCIDSLLFYDGENTEVPCLAESYDVSKDGLTYTFHIRKGMKWADSQGREIADIVADDWVAGLQHVCDSGSGLGELFIGVIANIQPYLEGEDTDFSKVGIKAVDDYTLEYTLEKKVHYFTSMLHYGISLPLCRSYYTSQGGKFGEDYNTEDESYQYGIDPDHIAYSGPFLITNFTENNSINYKANPLYWDAANVTLKELSRTFNDGSDSTKAYQDLKAGVIDQSGLNTSTIELAKEEKMEGSDKTIMEEYAYVTSSSAASYSSFMNFNRAIWNNSRAENEAVSPQSEEDAARTHVAMNNLHFRRAVVTSLDRKTWNEQTVGEDVAELCLRNTYTPGTFVSMQNDVTVEINGESVTFPAGTDYGEIMQAQIDADGFDVTVYKKDPNAENGKGSGDGFDGWYNPEYAKKELELAIAELESAGVSVDESNPIQLDFPYPATSTTRTNQAQVMKQSMEETLDHKVQINLVECESNEIWYYTGYYTERGYEANYEMFDLSGWSPDFMDPCSYIDTFLPDYNGYMTKCCGVY